MTIETRNFSLKSHSEPLDKALIVLRLSLSVSLVDEESVR